METRYLDSEIEKLKWLNRGGELSDYGKEKLNEFEAIKEALNIPPVSNSVCECCNENEAKVKVNICHSCDEHKLNSTD